MKWFTDVRTVEELRKQYRALLKQHHPDNGGSTQITQEINAEYDRLFSILKEKELSADEADTAEENTAFKEILGCIIHIDADIEIIGSWLWVHGGYEYRELLKSVGFRFAPKKKCWCWHFGEYRRCHNREIPLSEIREKYGSQKVKNQIKQRKIKC